MFAYGQTGAGKSFSMMGDSTEEGAGIIPRLAAALLQRLKEKREAGTDVSVEVRCFGNCPVPGFATLAKRSQCG